MKIIQSCGSFSWGGLEMSALQTADALMKRGHMVIFLCPKGSKLDKKANEIKVPTFNIFGSNKKNSIIKSTIRLKKLLDSDIYDIVHTHLSHDLWTVVPALRFSKTSSDAKLILTKHMASGVSKKDIFHRLLYKRINIIIAVSEFIKKSVIKTCPVDEKRVVIIPDAISLATFDPDNINKNSIRRELGIDDNCITTGIIGRMTPGKGHEEFLNAAKRIKEAVKSPVKFIVTGEASFGENSYELDLKNLASKLSLDEDIIFTGFREDVAQVLSAIDILAFPSHEESFGITLIEAMAMKVPIAASNNAGVIDIVINGKTGILIPPKDYVSLANAIIGLMDNPGLRKKLGEEGRKRVKEKFNMENTIKELEDTYSGQQ